MNLYKFYGVLMVIFGAFFYSTKAILVKLGFLNTSQDGLDLLMLRMLFSFPFYFIVFLVQTKKKSKLNSNFPNLKEHFVIASTGFLGYYLASYWDFVGLQYITANLERVILFIYPSVVLIVGALIYRRKINKTQIISITICWLGVAVAYLSDKMVTSNSNILKGSFFILAAGIAYGLYLALSENVIKKFGSVYYTALSMIISCVAVFITYFYMKGFTAILEMSTTAYTIGLAIAFFSTVIPAFLMAEGIQRIGSGNMAIIGTVGPVITILLSIVILNEIFTVFHLVGTILVLSSVFLISRKTVNNK